MIEPEPLQQVERTRVRFRNRKLIYFSGCDYYRLASHPKVMAAAQATVSRAGLNVAASRLTTGNHRLYGELERELGNFFGAQSAVLVPTGYMADMVAAQALAGNFSHALIDSRAHPALKDAARFLDCPILEFASCNPEALAAAVKRCGPEAKHIVLTEGMFSHNGSTAPLREYMKLLPADAVLLVDDAHGGGILGARGRGTLEHEGIGRRRVVQTVTLSKAFGSYGGVVMGDAGLRRRILARSQAFVGSTPLPLPLARAALEAVRTLSRDASLRLRLFENADYAKAAIRASGFDLPATPGPIVALRPKTIRAARRFREALLGAGIYPPFIHYPGGPAGGYFRFVISSEHSRPQLDALARVVQRANVMDFEAA